MSDPYQAVLEHYSRLEFADILEIGRTNDDFDYMEPMSDLGASFPDGYDSSLINFRLINETGNIPQVMKPGGSPGIFYQSDPSSDYWGSQRVDWNADDEFNTAYDTIIERSIERIEESPELYDLRVQSSWGYDERVAWEKEIAGIVSEEMAAIKGLDRYRLDTEDYPETSLRAEWVNALSQDITNSTISVEHDCETMSIIEGSILQRLDEHFLPSRTVEGLQDGNLMMQHNYFYARGEVSFDPTDEMPGGHAFIVSSATGNVIEATNDPNRHVSSPYVESADSEWNFERFVRGDVFEGNKQYVYAGDLENFVAERSAAKAGDDYYAPSSESLPPPSGY